MKKGNVRQLNNKGFSLVEVLIGMAILAILSIPVLSSFTNAARMNNKARREENANTAASAIVEDFKASNMKDILEKYDGQYTVEKGVYTFDITNAQKTTSDGVVNYYKGNNDEEYYIEAKLEPSKYTSGSDTDKNYTNNINSYVNSVKNFVIREELFASDDEADNELRGMVGASYNRKDVVKTTTINVNVKKNESSENKGKNDGIDDYYQSVSINMEYKYKDSDVYKYEKQLEFPNNYFKAKPVGSNTYQISSKVDSNLKDVYIFYSPFDNISTNAAGTSMYYCSDIVNINYNYEKTSFMNYDNCNLYIIQQTVFHKDNSNIKMAVNKNNVHLNINGTQKMLDGEGTLNLSDVANASGLTGPVSLYSNIYEWNLLKDKNSVITPGSNDVANNNLLYTLTVTVKYKEQEEPIVKLVTTKVG